MSLGDESLGDGRLNRPFERREPERVDLNQAHIAGGATVMAAAVPVPVSPLAIAGQPGATKDEPGLVFLFMHPTGERYPPMVLVLSREEMAQFPKLVADAAETVLDHLEGDDGGTT